MNKIEKLLAQISKADQKMLDEVINKLTLNPFMNGVKKLSATEFYRYRKGKFRIIFHIKNKRAVIDNIRLRNGKTYKNF